MQILAVTAEEDISPLIMPEEAFEGDYIIATYFYSSKVAGEDIYEKAKSFAVGQTIGTWVPIPGITHADEEEIWRQARKYL